MNGFDHPYVDANIVYQRTTLVGMILLSISEGPSSGQWCGVVIRREV